MAGNNAVTSPPAQLLGLELKQLRGKTGLSVDAVAARLGIGRNTIYRAEEGEGTKKELYIRAMCDLYEAGEERTEYLLSLNRESKVPGWWTGYDIPAFLIRHIAMESVAADIWWFEPLVVPGLLQTEDYARAIIAAGQPSEATGEAASKVEFRMRRQAILTRATRPPHLHFVIGEEVLRRPIGSAEIHAAQMNRLIQAADMPNVSLRVVPAIAGYYRGVGTGPFSVLHFPSDSNGGVQRPPTVYAEGFITSAGTFDNPAEVGRYTDAFEDIRTSALKEPESRALIKLGIEEIGK